MFRLTARCLLHHFMAGFLMYHCASGASGTAISYLPYLEDSPPGLLMAQHCCLPGLSKLVDHCPGCLGASPINSGLPPINSGIPPSILGSPHQFRVLPSFYQPPAPPVPIWQSVLPPGIVLAVSPSFLGVLTSFFLHYVRLINALLMHLTRPYNEGYNIY